MMGREGRKQKGEGEGKGRKETGGMAMEIISFSIFATFA